MTYCWPGPLTGFWPPRASSCFTPAPNKCLQLMSYNRGVELCPKGHINSLNLLQGFQA